MTVKCRRMFLCMNRFVFMHAEAFTPWFYSDGPCGICNLSESLWQTLFIHLWNRLCSSEECWYVAKLHWCTLLLLCIPGEMEKDKIKDREQKNAKPHIFVIFHLNTFQMASNTENITRCSSKCEKCSDAQRLEKCGVATTCGLIFC